jgi:hypothetical protein
VIDASGNLKNLQISGIPCPDGRRRKDKHWYPTMRLFRQSTLGDWQPVVEKVRNALLDECRAAELGIHCRRERSPQSCVPVPA